MPVAVQRNRETSVGYLPQEGMSVAGRNLFAEVRAALPELNEIQQELDTLHAVLEANGQDSQAQQDAEPSAEQQEALARYGELQHRFEELGGFRADAEVAKVLTGLGFRGRPVFLVDRHLQWRLADANYAGQTPLTASGYSPLGRTDEPSRS